MNKTIKDIINRKCTDEEKERVLKSLSEDIETAKGILSGKFKYCPDCNDYYLSKSFLSDVDTKSTRICTWQDPINSGGNEYEDGFVDITYTICPKGHKHEVNRKEKRQ